MFPYISEGIILIQCASLLLLSITKIINMQFIPSCYDDEGEKVIFHQMWYKNALGKKKSICI